MEPKVVSLEQIPGHPKYIRLPSLSRSLIHSILPKACQEMHLRPSIFTIATKPSFLLGPPALCSNRQKKKKTEFELIKRAENIRPSTTSYTYKKVYQTKSEPRRLKRSYYSPKLLVDDKKPTDKLFYCEVALPKVKHKSHRTKPIRSLNSTYVVFNHQRVQQDDLRDIPEVQSSMESSEFTADSFANLDAA